jgi:hypothetical protein
MSPRAFVFAGGEKGAFRVTRMEAIVGETLPSVSRIAMLPGIVPVGDERARWFLRGTTSNDRYVTRVEKEKLVARSPDLGRPAATSAALIPIRKSSAWWAMTQDERRNVFEEQSHHTEIGLRYLPAVARRLHHCRDLGSDEPFDFLTWFEFAPSDERVFDELVTALRDSPEWRYVEREVDIRLVREER